MIKLHMALDFEKYDILETMDTATMDLWVSQHVGLSRCKAESSLYTSKWFDYRIMHPLVATCLFTEVYKLKHSQITRTHGREDLVKAYFTTGLKRVSYLDMSKANITSLWKARQVADRYCVPYDYFVETILSIAASRLWDKLPRPQHMWQEDLIEIFEEKMKTRMKTTFDDSDFSFQNASQIINREIQMAYCQWIINRVKDMPSSKRVYAIANVAVLNRLVPMSVMQKCFPAESERAQVFC